MTFYIRPRQDISLATFSRILKSLYDKGIPHNPTLMIERDSGKISTAIQLTTMSKIIVEAAINCICDDTGWIRDNFKIIEVNE